MIRLRLSLIPIFIDMRYQFHAEPFIFDLVNDAIAQSGCENALEWSPVFPISQPFPFRKFQKFCQL